ncbi:hypothetical protein HMPREF1146_0184 [Prevotella sp. MSX73]|nr:hypothetical protein HMPREF1146_0184 [Prevotella sp. MSX73]
MNLRKLLNINAHYTWRGSICQGSDPNIIGASSCVPEYSFTYFS